MTAKLFESATSRFACAGPLTIPVALLPNVVPTPSALMIGGGEEKHDALKYASSFDSTDPGFTSWAFEQVELS